MSQSAREVQACSGVFEHLKRREWGLGILAWENADRRGYVFESGRVRVLAQPFFSLMRKVERPAEEVTALYECLRPEIEAARADRGSELVKPREMSTVVSFESHLAAFRSEYPAGFADTRWLRAKRGANANKRVAAHRDAAIAEARELLGAKRLKLEIADRDFPAAYRDLHRVLAHTDLVPTPERATAESADPERQRVIAIVFTELLHGKGEPGARLASFLVAFQQATGKPAGWQLSTALPALLAPAEQLCVCPTAFRTQARRLGARLAIAKLPTGAGYQRCLATAKLLSTKLADLGVPPQDLLDVHDFMRFTARAHKR